LIKLDTIKNYFFKKVIFSSYGNFFWAKMTFFEKSKPLKIWFFFLKTKRFHLNVTIPKKIEKVIFSAYGEFLAENEVFGKSKPLKIWNFRKNKKVSSWCDDFKTNKKK